MPRKPAPKPDDPAESKRFIDTAREVEASEDPKEFDKAFKRVTEKPPKKEAARQPSRAENGA